MKFPDLTHRLRNALIEDGAFNDVTTRLLPRSAQTIVSAEIQVKQAGIFCGAFLLEPIFKLMDPRFTVRSVKKDGIAVKPGHIVARFQGKLGAVLAGERLFLNLACRLSGIATQTNKFVKAIGKSGTHIVDTRKTTPLWRDVEKFAVRCGGGHNHRFSLSDAVLVKDNHVRWVHAQGQVLADHFDRPVISKNIKSTLKFVEIEATTLSDVREALAAKADVILLDNMPVKLLKESIALIQSSRTAMKKKTPLTEISGGVSLKNVAGYARLGVDRISVGALTHSAPALNMSLEVI